MYLLCNSLHNGIN